MRMSGSENARIVPVGEAPSFHEIGSRQRILVVDDEASIADTITAILAMNGYAATAAYDGNEALESALVTPPNMVITDVFLPGINGIELAITIQRVFPDCKILLFSGQASTVDLLAESRGVGHHFTLLNKPVPPEQLLAMVKEKLRPATSQAISSAN